MNEIDLIRKKAGLISPQGSCSVCDRKGDVFYEDGLVPFCITHSIRINRKRTKNDIRIERKRKSYVQRTMPR